jgi:hypothetical protein
MIELLTQDIRAVQQLLKKESLHSITVIVSAAWKYVFVKLLRHALAQTRDVREVLKFVTTPSLAAHAMQVQKLTPMLVRDPSRIPSADVTQDFELRAVRGATDMLRKTFGCAVVVEVAEQSTQTKAAAAFPGKPAIVLQ